MLIVVKDKAMLRGLFFSICFVLSISAFSQHKILKNEFGLQIDNDLFLMNTKDGYYTSGYFLRYGFVSSKSKQFRKNTLELGQQLFTPKSKQFAYREIFDRPYAGYTFLKYKQTRILPKERIFNWSADLGLIGPASGASAVQELIHTNFGFDYFPNWKYQIPNLVAMDVGMQYTTDLTSQKQTPSKSRIIPSAEINLGTAFTNIKVGSYFLFGASESLGKSALFNNRIGHLDKDFARSFELFIYYNPQLTYQIYNATIQGGFSGKNGNAIVSKPTHVFLENFLGLCYANYRTTFRVLLVYQGKEAISQYSSQRYISLGLSQRF